MPQANHPTQTKDNAMIYETKRDAEAARNAKAHPSHWYIWQRADGY
jgi:hypothetical protein